VYTLSKDHLAMNPLARTLAIMLALGCALAGCKPADPAPRPVNPETANRLLLAFLCESLSEFIVMIAAIEESA
jgi:hypothetical protein